MNTKNIYAYTGKSLTAGYVGYISVNQRENGIEFSVRSEGVMNAGIITLTPEQCEQLATDLIAHLNGDHAPAQQQEPDRVKFERHWRKTRGEKKANRELPRHPLQPQTYIQDSANRHWVTWQAAVRSVSPQLAQQQEWVACRDEMCACRGGPCASCPDGEREKELADMRDSRDFYKRRTDELQKAQSQMRDPERTMVCDILANGRLLVPAAGRYNTSPPASASVSVERVEPVPAAMKTIIQAMQQDPEYAWGWHCNIAMAFVDAGGDHYTGNQGAARFMKLLANVEPAHELPSPQPSQRSVEPVANGLPLVIAGAIFDFAGYLTTRDTVIEVGSTANASPVADLVKDWAALRGLSLADAAVLSWQEWLTDVRANDTSKERVDEMQKQRHDTTPPQPASKPWVGLTDAEIRDWWRIENGLEDCNMAKLVDFTLAVRAIEAKLKEKNT